jgi:phage tail-like protein
MATAQRNDPLRSFHFAVELEGITLAGGFSECSGIAATTEPEEVNEGGLNSASRKFVGRTKHDNLTLKRGLTQSAELYNWFLDAVRGKIQRKSGSIVLYDERGKEAVRWNFVRGWPAKWEGPALNATGNDVAIETLEIAHEGLERERR